MSSLISAEGSNYNVIFDIYTEGSIIMPSLISTEDSIMSSLISTEGSIILASDIS